MFFGQKRKKEKLEAELRQKLIARLDGRGVLYVAERTADTPDETILCRNSVINVTGDEITIYSDAHEVFRCDIDGAVFGELMSLDGATLRAFDKVSGKEKRIIAYYTKG